MNITEDHIEKALNWLRDNAEQAAQARANRVYMEEWRKVVKAQCMAKHQGTSYAEQERRAYMDADYINHLDALKEAIEVDSRNGFLRAAAEAKIEAWRTQNANRRAEGRVTT